MVTLQLQPFLQYTILAFKKSYCTGIWLSNINTGQACGKDTYLDGRRPFDRRQPLKEDDPKKHAHAGVARGIHVHSISGIYILSTCTQRIEPRHPNTFQPPPRI